MANIYIIPNTTSAIQLKKIIEELGDFYYVKIVDSLENISYPDLLITAGDVAEFKDSIKELVESGVPLITLGSSSVTDQPVTYLGLSDTLSQFSSDGTKTRHTKPITSHNIWSWNNISLSTDLTLLSNGSYAQSYVPESSTFGSNVVSLACSYDSSAERTILYAPKESNLGAEVLFIGQSYLTGDGSYTQTFKNIFQASIDFLLGTQYNINGVVKTNAGVPLSRNIFVHESSTGVLSGSAKSSITDGSYTVNNLNNKEKYVVCIDDQYKSFLKSKVVPKISNKLTYSGELVTNEAGNGVAGSLFIEGGLPPYTVSVVAQLPYGLTPVIDYRTLTITGTSEDWGRWHATLRITSANSVTLNVPVSVDINAAWTPMHLSTPPKIWLDHESSVTGVSGYASAWANRGSIGGSFTQNTPSSRPLVLPSGLNGRCALRFGGSRSRMSIQSASAGSVLQGRSAASLFYVMRSRGIVSNWQVAVYLPQPGGDKFGYLYGTPGTLDRAIGASTSAGVAVYSGAASTSWAIGYGDLDLSAKTSNHYHNGYPGTLASGVSTTSSNFGGAPTSDNAIQIGANWWAPSDCLNADVSALLLFDNTLSVQDRQRLEGYYAHEYALTSNLPADHPFRCAPPYTATPALQQAFATSPVVLGFYSATSGGTVGAATGPAVTTLGTWFNGGPSLSTGQGVSVTSDGTNTTITLTAITPPATPARAVLLDHKGLSIATVPLTASGSNYTGTVAGALADATVYYVRIEAA